jgi:hypothetical protein
MGKKKSNQRKKKTNQGGGGKRNNSGARSPPLDPTTTVCKFYAKGECKNGDNCKFVHSDAATTTASITAAAAAIAALPPGLESSMSLFTPTQQKLAEQLCSLPGTTHQRHLFDKWSSTADADKKKQLMSKLELIDQSYPDGGLIGYLSNAINLLEKSRRGENPLEGWIPSVPKGEAFTVGTDAFLNTEQLGLKEVGKCGFVLVAGGLGERLGYGDIKVSFILKCYPSHTSILLPVVLIYIIGSYASSIFDFSFTRLVCQPNFRPEHLTFNFTLRLFSPSNLDMRSLVRSFLCVS